MGGGAAEPLGTLVFGGGAADSLLGDVQTRQLRVQVGSQPGGIPALAAAHIQDGTGGAQFGGVLIQSIGNGRVAAGFQECPAAKDLLPGIAGVQGALLLDREQVDITLSCHIKAVIFLTAVSSFDAVQTLTADGADEFHTYPSNVYHNRF